MRFVENFMDALFVACIGFFFILIGAVVIFAFGAAIWFIATYLFGTAWIVWPIGIGLVLLYSLVMAAYLTIKDKKAEKATIIRGKH